MTTRDPRSRVPQRPDSQGGGRDPTQSLSLSAEEGLDEPSHPSLALGTADAQHDARHDDERTKIESPAARSKTPAPPSPRSARPPPVPPRGGFEEPERVGSVLGSYKVLELLGKGGMGYVFRAEHVKLGREVALKLLRSDYARRRDAVARFFQEARTVNRVRHRNIVDVTDFVELDDGTTFIIMEFLRGQSLGKWARTGIDLPRALAVLVQICDGLSAAHQVGVVHRDLKPDNIIIVPTSDGAELVKLLDFGVAKLLNRDDEDIGFQTAAGSVIGTPAYMSPEQAGGMVIDARSDTYSLGAIMYELFCGQPMFRGRSFGEYVRKHLTEMPTPPRATEGGRTLEPHLEGVIMRCLEKDPNRRFNNIMDLRDALLGMLGGMETHPPGLGSLSSSLIRSTSGIAPSAAAVAPTVVPPMLPTMIPQQPHPMMLPTPAPSGGHPSIVYGYTNAGYSQLMLPPPPPVQITPWWVWFVGGALAVGLGIAAAVWYAGRSETPAQVARPATPVATKQTSTPIDVPVAPQFVELRFESMPSGGVFAEGTSAELCRTPCATKLNLRDGGSTERRAFLVRSEGHKDGRIDVDLTGPQREFQITLVPLTIPHVTEPIEDPVQPDKVDDKPDKPDTTGKVGKHGKTGKTSKVVKDKPPEPDIQRPEVKDLTPPDKDPKKPDKIDPSDTLDPFRRK